MQWNDLRIILAISRSGTLMGAAKLLGQNHSTIFRQINAIEKRLEVRFFERLASGYVKTEAGEVAVRAAERIDAEIHGLSRELVGKDQRLQGTIVLTAPEGLSQMLLVPLIAKFCKRHPDIHIDFVVSSSDLALSRREADLALRVTSKPPGNNIGRRISRFDFGLYATQGYINKHQQAKLEEHHWLLADNSRNWFSTSDWKKISRAQTRTVMSSNSIMTIVHACKDGLGVAMLPCFLGNMEKKLVQIKQTSAKQQLELWILSHPDLRHTARILALKTFLFESLSKQKKIFFSENIGCL